jgi:hypothetical protein
MGGQSWPLSIRKIANSVRENEDWLVRWALCLGSHLSVAAAAQDQPQSGKLLTFDVIIAEVPEGAPATPPRLPFWKWKKRAS